MPQQCPMISWKMVHQGKLFATPEDREKGTHFWHAKFQVSTKAQQDGIAGPGPLVLNIVEHTAWLRSLS